MEPLPRTETDLEEWFLSQLEAEPLPFEPLLTALRDVAEAGEAGKAASWADLLQETVNEYSDAITLLALRDSWQADPAFRRTAHDVMATLCERDRPVAAILRNVGFDGDAPLTECLRRFRLMLDLTPGALCYEKTWGFGVVKVLDDFREKITIDFERKRGHEMSLAYAAEVLQHLDDEHLLARRHRDPDGLHRLAAEAPGDVVKIALRSFGPRSVVQLQEHLSADVLGNMGWKKFWDGARKALKNDPLVEFPSARTQPLRLLECEESYGPEWFARLAGERDVRTILDMLDELWEHGEADVLNGQECAVVYAQLEFAFKGAWRKAPELAVRALLAASACAVPAEQVDVVARTQELFEPDLFLTTAQGLPARLLGPFLTHLADADKGRAAELLLATLPRMHISLLNEGVSLLFRVGQDERCAAVMGADLFQQRPSVEILLWLARHCEKLVDWKIGSPGRLPDLALTALARDYHGEQLKARKQLLTLFQQEQWLMTTLSAMSDIERREFMVRLKDTQVMPAADRQSMLAKIVKRFPEILEALKDAAHDPAHTESQARLTSWRTYRERKAQYDRLVNEDIPQNSKDIAIARSYGDLSENHEYKAAKEMQGILLRRRGEMEAGLSTVMGTDFQNPPLDVAGPGTTLRIERPDGSTEEYAVLGEWDTCPEFGIISHGSRVARDLQGHKPGDHVQLPSTSGGEEKCTLLDIGPLSDRVRAWMAG